MKKKLTALLVGAALMIGMATTASALSIKFQQTGFADLVVRDTDLDGFITLSNVSYGDFKLDFVGGNSSLPANPSVNALNITTFTVKNQVDVTKTLTTSISDIGYSLNPLYPTSNNALVNFALSAQPTASNTSAKFNAYLDDANILFGTAQLLGSWTPNPLTTASNNTITNYATVSGNPFLLSEVIEITQGKSLNSNQYSQFAAGLDVAPVPEPGTMVLLGFGLLGLAVYGKRRMNKEA